MMSRIPIDDLRDFFLEQCRKCHSSSAENLRQARYSTAGQLIVAERFEYKPRPEQERQIVDCLRTRQTNRNQAGSHQNDKIRNPLIAVTGAPGSGKSTLLAHFPESRAYVEYLASCHPDGTAPPPIVSAVTFNSGMDVDGDDDPATFFGLRVLFGALSCMHPAPASGCMDWSTFRRDFYTKFKDIPNPKIAVGNTLMQMLREVYGEDRRVLLLIDELAKADDMSHPKWNVLVMADLGVVLNQCGWADVVVSSLSSPYIADLMTGSQRRVEYVALPVLLDVPLGAEEARAWADAVLTEAALTNPQPFVANLLRNVNLLASGHPRSIENLVALLGVDEGSVDYRWDDVVSAVALKKNPFALLKRMAAVIQSHCDYCLDLQHYEDVLPMMLSCQAVALKRDSVARRLVEEGSIYLVPRDPDRSLLAVVRFDNLLELLKHANALVGAQFTASTSDVIADTTAGGGSATAAAPAVVPTNALCLEYTRLFSRLFGEFVMRVEKELPIRIGVLWERAVALTIVCRSLGARKVLGADKSPLFECTVALTVEIAENAEYLNSPHVNVLVLSPPHSAGHDGRLITCGYVVYLQMKIAVSDKTAFLEMVAKTVVYCIMDHLRCPCTREVAFTEVRIVMYVWGSLPLLEQGMLEEAVQNFIVEARRKGDHLLSPMSEEEIATLKEGVNLFVSDHFANIVLLDKGKLDRWLIPSLRPIPRMVEAMEKKD